MIGFAFLVFLLFALAIPLLLWLAIDSETSNPTVVDRADAERIAREQGGRGTSRADSNERPSGSRTRPDGRDGDAGWGSRSDDPWGSRPDDSTRDDRR